MRMSKLEKIVFIALFFATWIVLSAYAGGPIFSDEFLYIDLGLRGIAEPSYGNRYFHVYLQKIFMDLAPTPLGGVRAFWGLLIALTAALIYYHARTFTLRSTALHGIIALALFFSFPFITEYSGEPAVDITAMAMVLIYITIYLTSLEKTNERRRYTIMLGTLAFLAFKTKETTLLINFLWVGYLLDEEGNWHWEKLWGVFANLLLGVLIGILLFIVMDVLVLGRPFFAISPGTFNAIFTHYDFGLKFFNGPTNWYKEYFLSIIMVPFLLYLMSSLKIQDQIGLRKKLILLYPLIMAAFVTVNMLKIPWGFIKRFYFPALPVVAFVAPQFLQMELPKSRKEWIGFGLLLAVSAALILVIRSGLMCVSALLYFDFGRFLDSLYYPVLLSTLLAAIIWMKKYNWIQAILPIFCIAALLFSPLLYTHKYYFRYPQVRDRYDEIFLPYAAFGGELEIDEGDRLYVSSDLKRGLSMLSDDPNDIVGMYNFYFDARISDKNIYLGYQRGRMVDDLIEKEFKFALISAADWDSLSEIEKQAILSECALSLDASETIYLLTFKE